MKNFYVPAATFLGIGYCPLAPGTAASLAVVLLYRFLLHGLSWPIFAGIILAVGALGVWSADRYAKARNIEDPGEIVIDEVLGQMVALFAVHFVEPGWGLLAAAFFLFRALDIFKPFLIRRAERIPGGWGIMLDDLLAGLYTGIIIQIYLHLK
jgi:phosphatidylglycerophosphatase A